MFAKAAMSTAESGTYARQNRSCFFHTPTLDPRAMFHAASNPIGIAAIEAGTARLANRVKFVKNDMDRLCRAHDNLINNSYHVTRPLPTENANRASAFLERRATMEIHRSSLAEFGFPEEESYWGVLSQKSRDYIKELAKSEWACLHNRNVFVSEIDAVLDALKTERKATTKSSQRKADLQASKRSQRRSDMKMDLKSL
ncbi:hypothetical protein HDU77_003463 [Chytriomyces hyalinus]|nr:hypothetical protein HDU77_003463 [Chytriomyces hyalinus]